MDTRRLNILSSGCAELAAAGIQTLTEAKLLLAAEQHRRQKGAPGDLSTVARRAGIPLGTASRAAFGLSRAGLLVMEPHPTDRRRRLLRPNLEKAGLAG